MKKPHIVLGSAAVLIVAFIVGAVFYQKQQASEISQVVSEAANQPAGPSGSPFARPDAPSLGPLMAKVQIMEFFDPACEACRAYYPLVKEVMEQHRGKVRLTLRYATFHKGSDYVAKVLEAARMQGQDIYWKSLEAILVAQPTWADHGRPQPELVWNFLKGTGLDIERARRDMDDPRIAALLKQDAEDIETLRVRQTPTFFINRKPLAKFGEEGLRAQVRSEISGQP